MRRDKRGRKKCQFRFYICQFALTLSAAETQFKYKLNDARRITIRVSATPGDVLYSVRRTFLCSRDVSFLPFLEVRLELLSIGGGTRFPPAGWNFHSWGRLRHGWQLFARPSFLKSQTLLSGSSRFALSNSALSSDLRYP